MSPKSFFERSHPASRASPSFRNVSGRLRILSFRAAALWMASSRYRVSEMGRKEPVTLPTSLLHRRSAYAQIATP